MEAVLMVLTLEPQNKEFPAAKTNISIRCFNDVIIQIILSRLHSIIYRL